MELLGRKQEVQVRQRRASATGRSVDFFFCVQQRVLSMGMTGADLHFRK